MIQPESIFIDWIKVDNLYYPRSIEGEILRRCGFQQVEAFCEGIAKVSDGLKWGCIDCKGDVFIPIKYDTIIIEEFEYAHFYLRCGYNGVFFTGVDSSSSIENEKTIYSGIYDLFDFDGNFLLGGFDECRYDTESHTFQFLFGREWQLNYADSKGHLWKNEYGKSDRFAKWLILTEDFKFPFDFFIQTKNPFLKSDSSIKGHRLSFKIIHLNNLNGEFFPESMFTTEKWVSSRRDALFIDLPGEVLFDSVSTISSDLLLCAKNCQYCLIYINKRKVSDYFQYIMPIDDVYAYVYDGLRVGMIKNAELIIGCSFNYITNPINDCVFAVRKYPYVPDSNLSNNYYVIFLNLKKKTRLIYEYDLRKEVVAIRKINKDHIYPLLTKGVLRLFTVNNNSETAGSIGITIQKGFFHFFSEQFRRLVHRPGHVNDNNPKKHQYWISIDDMRAMKEGPHKRNDYNDNYDIWDALESDPEAYWNID